MFRGILLPFRRARRVGFRGFLLTLLALYFGAMYLMQSDLGGVSPRSAPDASEMDRRWARVGADANDVEDSKHDRQQRAGEEPVRLRRGKGLQEALFDSIQQQDRLDGQAAAGGGGVGNVNIRRRPEKRQSNVTRRLPRDYDVKIRELPVVQMADDNASDRNVPASCTSDDVTGRQERDGLFVQPDNSVLLLSAYWDERPNDFDNRHNGTFVRLMAVVRGSARPRLACLFAADAASAERLISPVSYYEMCENHGRPCGSFILSCAVPQSVARSPPPCTVAVSSGGSTVQLNVRTLRPPRAGEEDGRPMYKTTVCVPPLFGNVPPARLVEFIELSFVLGADHIVLYDFNVPETTVRLINYFADRCRLSRRPSLCRVDLLRWRLPADVDAGIWYHGQSISLQDCLYRQMASSERVVFSDIDEFVVPHFDDAAADWNQLVRRLDRPGRCAFQFSSAFFDPETDRRRPADDLVDNDGEPDLIALRAVRRSRFSNIRTKCMVRPYEIFEAGIHHISKPIWADLEVYRVPTDEAFLHHYRKCVGLMGMDCSGQYGDATMLRYEDRLLSAVRETDRQLASILS